MDLIGHISEIRYAIAAMNADRAIVLFAQLENKLKVEKVGKTDLPGVQEALDDILVLAQSTYDGVNSARRQIEKIISDADRIDVYDESGEKFNPEVGSGLAWKY